MRPVIPEANQDVQGSQEPWKYTLATDYHECPEIGRGRYARLKKYVTASTGREVVCKCMSKTLVPRESAQAEFCLLQQLQHPGIVNVIDLYDAGDQHVIVMEM